MSWLRFAGKLFHIANKCSAVCPLELRIGGIGHAQLRRRAARPGDRPYLVGGPVLALQWTKGDLEALGLVRLDISPSAAMGTVGIGGEPDEATQAAAWRLLEAGDTLGISQVESVGFRMLLRRATDVAVTQSPHRGAR